MEARLDALESRNSRVETDKAWETSYTRRFCIALITYVFATIWLYVIGGPLPYVHATVPVLGYLLSTFSLPAIKNIWAANRGIK